MLNLEFANDTWLLCIALLTVAMAFVFNTLFISIPGTVFGAIAFFEILASFVGGMTTSAVYKATLHIGTGFAYFVMALVYMCAAVIYR